MKHLNKHNNDVNQTIYFKYSDPLVLIMYRLVLLALVISISGCGSTPSAIYQLSKREVAKNRPAYKQFQELCASPDRSRVYKTVNVDGYLFAATNGARCKGGWGALAEQGYKYFECSSTNVVDHDSISFEENIYRLEIGEKDDVSCVSWNAVADDTNNDKAKEYQELLQGKCFIISKVIEPKSNFVMLLENGYVDEMDNHILKLPNSRTTKDLIRFNGIYVFNLETGENLSIDRDYQYWPESINNKSVGKYTCEQDIYVNEIQVLRPNP